VVDLRQIVNVKEAIAVHQRSSDRVVGASIAQPQLFRELSRVGMQRYCAESLAFAQHQAAVGDTAEAVGLFQDRIEHRREVAG
jgi:hypothetical protein